MKVVHEAIQEDKPLRIIIKQKWYKMRIVKLMDMVYTYGQMICPVYGTKLGETSYHL